MFKVRAAKHNPQMHEVYATEGEGRQGIVYFSDRGDAERMAKQLNDLHHIKEPENAA